MTASSPKRFIQQLRGIIQRMSQLKEMHKIVSIVESRVEKLEEENNIDIPTDNLEDERKTLIAILENMYPKIEDIKSDFRTKYDCNKTRANNAYKDAVKEKYLNEMPRKVGTIEVPHFVIVTTEGRKLTSRDFGTYTLSTRMKQGLVNPKGR